MAEGLLKSLYGEYYDVYSAGSNPSKLNPYTVKIMKEIGIDISDHWSKSLKDLRVSSLIMWLQYVMEKKENVHFSWEEKNYLHESFEDPSAVDGTNDYKNDAFRRIRDEIKEWIIKNLGVKVE